MSKIERVILVLVCEDIGAGHDFLVEAFGFTSGGIHRNAEGKPTHAEVCAGDCDLACHRRIEPGFTTLDPGWQLRSRCPCRRC